MLFVRSEVADDDGRQRVGALQPHQMSRIEIVLEDVDSLAMRDQIVPVLALGRGERRGNDLEVDRVIGVGEDEQFVAAVGQRILQAFLPRGDEARRHVRTFEIDQPLLGRLVVAAGDHAKPSAGALMQMREPAGVLLLINQDVVRLPGAEAMPPHLPRAMVVIELDIEEAVAVLAPHRRAVGLLDEIVKILPVRPVAHAHGKIFRALGIGAPGVELVVGRMPAAAELEIFARLRELIAVEHDLFRAAMARHAPEQLMLPALAEFAEIGKVAVRRRHAGIVLLDAPAHLRDQLFLQGAGMPEHAIGIGVFRFEIFADIRIEHAGVVQHLLPVRVLQPGIVVGDGDAMGREGMRPARRDGCFVGLVHAILVRSAALLVIAGLDPAIHQLKRFILDGCAGQARA